MGKVRGFEVVSEQHRTAFDTFKNTATGATHKFPVEIKLPTRADKGSAGYDFYMPKDVTVLPNQTIVFSSDVKAYMQDDEVLLMYVRSSIGIKRGLGLPNGTGIIDSTYYSNPSNDGNIGIALHNNTGKTVELKKGERVVQGIFTKYLVVDNDEVLAEKRVGGTGSSGK